MIYYSKIVKIKMDYITKYQYVKLIHFLRRHLITDQHFFVTPKFSELDEFQPCSINVSKTWFLLMSQKI